jgi:hypothetical protein
MAQFSQPFWRRWDWRTLGFSGGQAVLDEGALDPALVDPPPDDRRGAARRACRAKTSCQVIALVRSEPWPIVLRDVSATGVGLLCEKPLSVGTYLAVELPNGAGDSFRKLARVRVVAVRRQPDGRWHIGCTFEQRLSDEEVRTVR